MASIKNIHFEISERKVLLRVMDVFFVLGTLMFIGQYFDFIYFTIKVDNFYWTLVLAIYINVIGSIFEMYNLQVASNQFQVVKSIMLTSSFTTLLYLLTPFYTPVLPSNRLQIILFFLAILLALLIWRNLYIIFLTSDRFIKRVIFIGSSKKIETLIYELTNENPHYQVSGFVATDEKKQKTDVREISLSDLERIVGEQAIPEIVVANNSKESILTAELYEILIRLLERGVVIRKYSDIYESGTFRLFINLDDKELYRFFPFSRSNQNKLFQFYTIIFNGIIATIGLLFFLPLLPFVYGINLIANKGPLFYYQERVGRNGNVFKIIKLRTMIVEAEQDGAVFAKINDVRITPFGKFLRRSRLDEVPQFINVLKGDMAIIGPRPERPVFVNEISQSIPLYQTRHIIRPGLTGWAQVNYPYGENLEDSLMKLRYDLYYIKHRSIFLDMNIVVKTLSTILFFRGQ